MGRAVLPQGARPMRLPANDNKIGPINPFKVPGRRFPPARPLPGYGKKFPKPKGPVPIKWKMIPRFGKIPVPLLILPLIDQLGFDPFDNPFLPSYSPARVTPSPGYPWVHTKCRGPMNYVMAAALNTPQTIGCLIGQAVAGAGYWWRGDARPPTSYTQGAEIETLRAWTRNNPEGAGGGYQLMDQWVRDIPEGIGGVPYKAYWQPVDNVPFLPTSVPPRLNPNIQRRLPGERPPPQRSPESPPDSPPDFPPIKKTFYPNVPTTVGDPAGRQPPRRGEREKKVLQRGMTAILLNVLDNVSEYAEIVDAFYDALPPRVRKRRPCDAKRGLLDNAGQYGIDNADCKARVLYDNWHLLDPAEALLNVMKNVAADQLHGLIHKTLPNNSGAAFNDALQAINNAIKNGPGNISFPDW